MIIACIIWLILLDLWQILPIIINFKAAIQAAIARQADVKMPRLRQRTAMSRLNWNYPLDGLSIFPALMCQDIIRVTLLKLRRRILIMSMSPSIKQALVLQSFSSDLTSLKNRRLTYHDSYLALGMLVLMQISISHLSSARAWKRLLLSFLLIPRERRLNIGVMMG